MLAMPEQRNSQRADIDRAQPFRVQARSFTDG